MSNIDLQLLLNHAIICVFRSFPFILFPFTSMQTKVSNYVAGLWKFSDKISTEQLEEIAQKWAAEDQNYLQLYIRKCSKNQYGIGFTHKLPNEVPTEGQHDEYFHKTSDYLKRQFGNDLVGWDLASPVWIIK